MRTTNRERVLMAMYAEHVNECGDFDRVRGQALGMESEGFIWAVMCLSREGLIGGVRWQPERSSNAKGVALERVGMHLKLLRNSKAYGLTDADVELTKKNLDMWKGLLDKLTAEGGE